MMGISLIPADTGMIPRKHLFFIYIFYRYQSIKDNFVLEMSE